MIFLRKSDIVALQHVLIDEFGGSHGLRDAGALESAVVAAENRHHYEQSDHAALAATYAFHLTQAHAFVDGNKRVVRARSISFSSSTTWTWRQPKTNSTT